MTKTEAALMAEELSPGLGVSVTLDIDRGISAAQRDALRQLFNRHHLLYIVAPNLSAAAQLDLFETFGKALPAAPDGKLEMIVSNTRVDGYLGTYEIDWHIDGSFVPEPFLANCLYALELEDNRSSTRFTSAATACDRLPAALKDSLRYLQVINTNEIEAPRGTRIAVQGSDLPAAAHRFIARHPVTGIPYIAANSYQTDCVLGLNEAESQALLGEVYRHLYAPEHVYEHWWRNGDLVIWDNLIVQHARGDMSTVGPRTLRRFTCGTATVADQLAPRQRDRLAAAMQARVGLSARRRPEAVQG